MDPALAAETLALSKQKALKDALSRGDSAVSAFFKDAVVFITGGSGFLGKQLVEKLIRASDVKKIYLLLRRKKGMSLHERLEDILQNPVYSNLRKETPRFEEKIAAIEGDLSQLKLGLSEDDWNVLSNEVNVIIHVAATVNLAQPLYEATIINVRGTREVLKLAEACHKLRSVVHVSTAYCHATNDMVKKDLFEVFYKCTIEPEELIRLAEAAEVEGTHRKLEEATKKIRSKWPNIYTFTKAVGEELVRQMGAGLPICIVRPAIVIGAYREPFPGWVDISNIFGAGGLMAGFMLGLIHVLPANKKTKLDIVPVDFVNNAILAAAWETDRKQDNQIKIYTVCGTRKPGTFDDLKNVLQQTAIKHISPYAVWYVCVMPFRNQLLYKMASFVCHVIPACVADVAMLMLLRKPMFVKLVRKANSIASALNFFLNSDWRFNDDNTLNLYNSLSATDKILYNCDIGGIEFADFVVIWHLGMRKYIIKDGLKDTEYALKKQKWLKALHYIVFPAYLYSLCKLSFFTFDRCKRFILFVYMLCKKNKRLCLNK